MLNSTDPIQDVVKLLRETKAPAEKATLIAELVLSELPDIIALTARKCIILHWFDQFTITTLLQNSHLTPDEIRNVYEHIISLPFVEKLPWGFAFQNLTREGLLKRYISTQPALLKSAAYLAARGYEVSDNEAIAAEALFCHVIAGNQVASEKLLDRLIKLALGRGNTHYIENLKALLEEAARFPFIDSDVKQLKARLIRARTHFFISYTSKDSQWAQWIAFELEAAGYITLIQAWDIRPGSNFVAEMDDATKHAERTLLVLSQAYLESDSAFAEWAAAFRCDPRGKQGKVLPVRIEQCTVEGLLGSIGYIDLVGLDEQKAHEKLLAGVKRERAKPASVPFPTTPVPSGPLVDRPVFPGSLPSVWNVPYARNSFFLGRDELLARLHAHLQSGQTTALSQPPQTGQITVQSPQAISGLGGIGKTQLTVEYAYRYSHDYEAVLWARAETRDELIASYSALAALLKLPEQHAGDQEITIEAVKRWLQTHEKWLLILDNADELALLPPFLPSNPGGHILLTTRAYAMQGLATRLEVETLSEEDGALLLLRRASFLPPDGALEQASEDEQRLARALTTELGGLPLALDQTGAYLEVTGMSLDDYLHIYQTHRQTLLNERRSLVEDHPAPVVTTWSLSFERVEEKNPAAADLLRLCAYLAPDAIPETIVTEGADHLGKQLAPIAAAAFLFAQAIEALRAYSLLSRDPRAKTLTVHRLVQAVTQDSLPPDAAQCWKQRAVLAVSAACPKVSDVTQWPACERWLPHALLCTTWIEQEQISSTEAALLLNVAGYYLKQRGRYREVEPLYQRALAIDMEVYGPEHPEVANVLNNLASLYQDQGKYAEAEALYQQARAIYEQQLGAQHPDTATSLNNLADLYRTQGKYELAEPLYRQVLKISKQLLGDEHPNIARSLNNLAELYREQGKYEQAEPLYQQALSIKEQQLGAQHPSTATSRGNLALLYYNQGKYEQAEPLFKRTLEIYEQQLGAYHPLTATSLNNLAGLYRVQGKYEQAEPLFKRALAIREQELGAQHPDTATSLNNLAALYRTQGKYAEAEPLLQGALSILKQLLGIEHPNTQIVRRNYAAVLRAMGREEEALKMEEKL